MSMLPSINGRWPAYHSDEGNEKPRFGYLKETREETTFAVERILFSHHKKLLLEWILKLATTIS